MTGKRMSLIKRCWSNFHFQFSLVESLDAVQSTEDMIKWCCDYTSVYNYIIHHFEEYPVCYYSVYCVTEPQNTTILLSYFYINWTQIHKRNMLCFNLAIIRLKYDFLKRHCQDFDLLVFIKVLNFSVGIGSDLIHSTVRKSIGKLLL